MGSTRTRKSMNNQKSDFCISVYVDPVDDPMGLLCKDYESNVPVCEVQCTNPMFSEEGTSVMFPPSTYNYTKR